MLTVLVSQHGRSAKHPWNSMINWIYKRAFLKRFRITREHVYRVRSSYVASDVNSICLDVSTNASDEFDLFWRVNKQTQVSEFQKALISPDSMINLKLTVRVISYEFPIRIVLNSDKLLQATNQRQCRRVSYSSPRRHRRGRGSFPSIEVSNSNEFHRCRLNWSLVRKGNWS